MVKFIMFLYTLEAKNDTSMINHTPIDLFSKKNQSIDLSNNVSYML